MRSATAFVVFAFLLACKHEPVDNSSQTFSDTGDTNEIQITADSYKIESLGVGKVFQFQVEINGEFRTFKPKLDENIGGFIFFKSDVAVPGTKKIRFLSEGEDDASARICNCQVFLLGSLEENDEQISWISSFPPQIKKLKVYNSPFRIEASKGLGGLFGKAEVLEISQLAGMTYDKGGNVSVELGPRIDNESLDKPFRD
ncbi:MAG: hypothetical protein AB7T49_00955 [Oligoflexales bacterium]